MSAANGTADFRELDHSRLLSDARSRFIPIKARERDHTPSRRGESITRWYRSIRRHQSARSGPCGTRNRCGWPGDSGESSDSYHALARASFARTGRSAAARLSTGSARGGPPVPVLALTAAANRYQSIMVLPRRLTHARGVASHERTGVENESGRVVPTMLRRVSLASLRPVQHKTSTQR